VLHTCPTSSRRLGCFPATDRRHNIQAVTCGCERWMIRFARAEPQL
jgi:hypothetical protein